VQPTVSIDLKTARDLDDALANLALLTGKSIEDVIVHGSFRAARSAAASIKMPSRFRKSTRRKSMFGDAKTRRKKGVPWWAIGMVEVWKKGQPRTTFVRNINKYNRLRAKPRNGLAKNTWKASATRFSRSMRPRKDARLANAFSTTIVKKEGRYINSVAMSNNLGYISKIAPNSARIGISNATKWVNGYAIPKASRQISMKIARKMNASIGRG